MPQGVPPAPPTGCSPDMPTPDTPTPERGRMLSPDPGHTELWTRQGIQWLHPQKGRGPTSLSCSL